MESDLFFFELLAHEEKLKGVFDKLYHCYGNVLSQRDNYNMFPKYFHKYFFYINNLKII